MKRSAHLGKRLLAFALVLCTITIVAFAAGYSRKILTNLVVDGKIYSNATNFEWDMEYVVPEGGIEWDGTNDFIYVTYPESEDIIEAPDGLLYIDGQLIFSAQRIGNIGAEFEQVEQLMAKYGARIIGYIAPTASYQVEAIDTITYTELLTLKDQIDSESLIVTGTTNISYMQMVTNNATIFAKHPFGGGKTNDQTAWNGDILDPNLPGGKNWGMEYTNALSAWKYLPLSYDVACSVWDGGYELHSDLGITPLIIPSTPNNVQISEQSVNHGTHVAGIMAANHDENGVSGVYDTEFLYGITNKSSFSYFHTATGQREMLESSFAFAELACMTVSVIRSGEECIDVPVVINHSMGRTLCLTGNEESEAREQIIHNIRCAWALQNGQAINEEWFERKVADWDSQERHYADDINDLADQGWKFVIVVAAGNEFNTNYSPITGTIDCKYGHALSSIDGEASNQIIVVGSIGWDGTALHADSSSVGDRVDIMAPGVDIWSSFSTEHYAYGSGTSMATPHVAGTAAFVWGIDPEFSPEQVKRLTLTTYRFIEKRDDDTVRTVAKGNYPLLNALAAVEAARDEARPATVYIKCIDLSDVPAASVDMILRDENGTVATLKSSADGTSQISLKPGEYTIVDTKSNYQFSPTKFIVKAGEKKTVTVVTNTTNTPTPTITQTVTPTPDPVVTPTATPTPTPVPSELSCYRTDTIDPVYDGKIIRLELKNAQGGVVKFDVTIELNNIYHVNTEWGLYDTSHGFEHSDTVWQFYLDSELINGASVTVVAEDGAGNTKTWSGIMSAWGESEGYMQSDN